MKLPAPIQKIAHIVEAEIFISLPNRRPRRGNIQWAAVIVARDRIASVLLPSWTELYSRCAKNGRAGQSPCSLGLFSTAIADLEQRTGLGFVLLH
jgi:hypothetical protein